MGKNFFKPNSMKKSINKISIYKDEIEKYSKLILFNIENINNNYETINTKKASELYEDIYKSVLNLNDNNENYINILNNTSKNYEIIENQIIDNIENMVNNS